MKTSRRQFASRAAAGVGILSLIAFTIFAGWRLRRTAVDVFDPLHFETDIQRGSFWGLASIGSEGLLNQYDKMAIERPGWSQWLDYVPLRLLLMDGWGHAILTRYKTAVQSTTPPHVYDAIVPPEQRGSNSPEHLQRSYHFLEPMIIFNSLMDGLGAILAGALTWLWVRRTWPSRLRAAVCGLSAAMLLWLNPNVVLSGYAWPTWDGWVAPLYLLAALLASCNCWFFGGIAVGIGAMLKGQQLAVAPVFVVWALVAVGIGPALRWLVGLLVSFAVIVSPWMLTYLPTDRLAAARAVQMTTPIEKWPVDLFAIARTFDWPALVWIIGIGVAVLLIAIDRQRRWAELFGGASFKRVAVLETAFVLAAWWPWWLARNEAGRWFALAIILLVGSSLIGSRSGNWRYWVSGLCAAALLLCMNVFHGGDGWWRCGFQFGTEQFPYMIYGPASNVPGILQVRFHWPAPVDSVAFTLPPLLHDWPHGGIAITTKTLLNGCYSVLLLLTGAGIGLHARRRDRRILVALTMPWILFFMLPVSLHERYLLFAATVSSICIGHSVGMTLLGFLLTIASSCMTLHQMFGSPRMPAWVAEIDARFPLLFSGDSPMHFARSIVLLHPDIGWALMMISFVFLYLTLVPSRS